jgi:hypothetical protein
MMIRIVTRLMGDSLRPWIGKGSVVLGVPGGKASRRGRDVRAPTSSRAGYSGARAVTAQVDAGATTAPPSTT